jgi:hypothetical protein
LADLYEDGEIDVESGGGGYDDPIKVIIVNKTGEPILITFPYGIWFESQDPEYQDLIIVKEYEPIWVPAYGEITIELDTACMDLMLKAPDENFNFVPKKFDEDEVMNYVAYFLANEYSDLSFEAVQSIVWFFTDHFDLAAVYNFTKDDAERAVEAIKAIQAQLKP